MFWRNLMAKAAKRVLPHVTLACGLLCGERLEARHLLSVSFSPGQTTGNVQASAVVEASGIVASREQADVFWTHNDSGDTARIFALNKQGEHLGTYNITGATATDWEDIALGPGPVSGVDYLYIGDIGDNGATRSSIRVYRVPEPVVNAEQAVASTSIASGGTITLVYPDGPRDAETLLVDPVTGDLYIVTKRDSSARIYRAEYPLATGQTTTLEFMGEMDYSGFVGGDISPNGTEILLKTYINVQLYQRPIGSDLWTALQSDPIMVPYTIEPQGEAVTFDRTGRDYFTLSEGANQPLRRFARNGEPDAQVTVAIVGDYGSDGPAEASVAALVASWNPSLVATVGDNNYEVGAAATIDANVGKHYQQFIGNYTGTFGPGAATNRFFPALGDRDWQTSSAQPYLNYFTLPGNERYYDFVAGAVHFFVLDSDSHEPDGVSANSLQAQWLRAEMDASVTPFQVVLLHDAPYSSGTEHGSNSTYQWPFQEWGADLVIAGGDHTYERLEIDGLPYIVNGLGGRSIDGFGEIVPGSKAIYNGDYGALRVTADSSQMTAEFFSVGDGGTLVDSLTIPVAGNLVDKIVESGALWKYLDNGSNQGTAWRAPAFHDAAWNEGPAQLGYGDNDESTVVSYGSNANNRYVTTYFRRKFNVTNAQAYTSLMLELLRDDGAIVYLNGTQIFSSNMPESGVDYQTLAPAAVSSTDESRFYSVAIDPALLLSGDNVLAVEVHQNAVNSSDVSFDLRLIGVRYQPPTGDAGGPYSGDEGTSIALQAAGSGVITLYEWDLDNNGSYETPGQNVSFLRQDQGEFAVGLRITGPGGTITDTTTVQVGNAVPTVDVSGTHVSKVDIVQAFTFTANDLSTIDAAAGFLFEIDWDGNGSFDQTSSALSSVNLSHSYTLPGSYHVQVRATDKDAGQSELLTHTVHVYRVRQNGANVEWDGSDGDDVVEFYQSGLNGIEVHTLAIGGFATNEIDSFTDVTGRVIGKGNAGHDELNAVALTTFAATLEGGRHNDTLNGGAADDILRGEFTGAKGDGAEGNDSILGGAGHDLLEGDGSEGGEDTLRGGIGNDTILGDGSDGSEGRADSIFGEDGDDQLFGHHGNDLLDGGNDDDLITGGDGAEANDTLVGGAGNDILSGGAGKDSLTGGTGADVFLGGVGVDTLQGDAGEDLLLADTTTFNLNAAALLAIHLEWTSAGSYEDRIAHLTGTAGGANGTTYLLPGTTLFEDAEIDTLTGGATDLDWFLYNLLEDVLSDHAAGESESDTSGFPLPE